jgi:hypothetical protein
MALLIELALERGARDNVTALVVQHLADTPPPARGAGPGRPLASVLRQAALPFLIGALAGFALRGLVGY